MPSYRMVVHSFAGLVHKYGIVELRERPNGLPISCAAILDRERIRAVSRFQNVTDLVAAQRRQLEQLVGPQGFLTLFVRLPRSCFRSATMFMRLPRCSI
jgi:hypothetical protein